MAVLQMFIGFEAVVSLVLTSALLLISVIHREQLMSHKARVQLEADWGRFKTAFFITIGAMFLFVLSYTMELLVTYFQVSLSKETILVGRASMLFLMLCILIISFSLISEMRRR